MASIEKRGFVFGICYLLLMSYFLISHLYAAESVITDSEGYACIPGVKSCFLIFWISLSFLGL